MGANRRGSGMLPGSATIFVAITMLVTGVWARAAAPPAHGSSAPGTQAGTPSGAQAGTASGIASGITTRSVWDAVYTEVQAQRGEELYEAHCVMCHGENLEGNGPAKALTGPEFAANWNNVSMSDMLERTRTSMPQDKPGTLSRQQVADVLSYLLSANDMPAGTTELSRQAEVLSGIKFLARKPSGY
jgi:mono/diheme cytochrome c family protein